MKSCSLTVKGYLNKCDYIYRYQIKSIYLYPRLQSLRISFSNQEYIEYLKKLNSFHFSENEINLNIFLFFLFIFGRVPYIQTDKKGTTFVQICLTKKTTLSFLNTFFPDFYDSYHLMLLSSGKMPQKFSSFSKICLADMDEYDPLTNFFLGFLNTKDVSLHFSFRTIKF